MSTLLFVLAAVILAWAVVYFGFSWIIAAVTAWVRRIPITRTPASLGLTYKDVQFCSRIDNVRLKGWYIPSGDTGTVIVVHGGKQNRADATMRLLELCCDLSKKGFNVLSFDRRGCGESKVSKVRDRTRFEHDVAGAYDYVIKKEGRQHKIFLLGVSLGAAAVLYFAAHEDGICGLVSDSCFADVREMAKRVLTGVNKALTIFVKGALWFGEVIYGLQPLSAIDNVKLVKSPVLFIHGRSDRDVPASDSAKLFAASNNPLNELYLVDGAGHSQAYSSDPARYIERVAIFFSSKCAGAYSKSGEWDMISTAPRS
jgi:pimeloyl-ACP methyl ester carboxylesterase